VATLVIGTQRFGGIFDQFQPVTPAYFEQRIQIHRMTEGMHRNHRFDTAPGPLVETALRAHLGDVGQIVGQPVRREPQGGFFTVDEVRDRTAVADRVGGGDEGQGGHQHFVILLHADQPETDMQRGRAVDDGDRAFDAGIVGQLLFEAVDELAHRRDPAGVETFLDVFPFAPGERGFMQGKRWFFRQKPAQCSQYLRYGFSLWLFGQHKLRAG